ncbi:uncharacterized protein JCM15063_004832 [Sporobolomyces koalae]|uniref:uncharacterized protein n=1 Tax=Sporobolomyces koalae TaxID=500713 RepID=UPI00316FB9EF
MSATRYRSLTSARLPPAKPPLFRSVVSHPPSGFAVQSKSESGSGAPAGKGKAKANAAHAHIGPHSIVYSTSPRPLIPLTTSPVNHRLWNPPAPDSAQTRSVEKDESGRLAKFSSRFGGSSAAEGSAGSEQSKKPEEALFGVEGDLSWLEGVTLQSPSGGLGKKDIVGPQKKDKKGKK